MQIMFFIRKLENRVVSDLVALDKYLITNNKLKISKTLRVSLDTEYRRSPVVPGDHAGQVVRKGVHETVRPPPRLTYFIYFIYGFNITA